MTRDNIIKKSNFNRLPISEQVDIFNNLLGDSSVLSMSKQIKEVCDLICISYSTIRDRFRREGYKYNKTKRLYERATNINFKELDKININHFNDDDVVVRSFRIRKKVLEDFILYSENSLFKQYDILSLFIAEGMDKYKKE